MKKKLIGWYAFGVVLFFILLTATQVTAHALTVWMAIPSRSGLYAVFLTNGQVYFGNISKENEQSLTLSHIYYIQLKNSTTTQSGDNGGDVSLLKLGNEFHGPEDMMEVNRPSILFIEKLKSDGRVAKAIQAYRDR